MEMTNPITTNPLTEKYDEAVRKATACADAQNASKPKAEVDALKKQAADAVTVYNAKAAETAYHAWHEKGEAIKLALEARYVPEAIKLSYKADKDSGLVQPSIKSGDIMLVSLMSIKNILGNGGVFHDKDWCKATEHLAYLVANAVDESLRSDDEFTSIVSDASRFFGLSSNADVTSKKAMARALQKTVDMILYIPTTDASGNEVNSIKADARYWAYIRECMTKKGKKPGQILVGGTDSINELVADVIHMLLTGKKPQTVKA